MKKNGDPSIADVLALTPVQEGMLFHYLQDPGSNVYNEQLCLELSGTVEWEVFQQAWDAVAAANEMLRAVFRWEKLKRPAQAVLKKHSIRPVFYDLSRLQDLSTFDARWQEIVQRDREQGFDLRQVPFRIILVKTRENRNRMIISFHHILFDGWSSAIILEEFFGIYHRLQQGEQVSSRSLKPPFKEYVKWLGQQDKESRKAFWEKYLAGLDDKNRLPVKRRISHGTGGGSLIHSVSLTLDSSVGTRLEEFARERRVTLAALFFCAWGILLQRYCDSDDAVFGTTVSGRTAPLKDIGNIVGLFINTIPLRIKTGNQEHLWDLLKNVNHMLIQRESHENTPLVDIAAYGGRESGDALFDTIVAVENYPLDSRMITPRGSELTIESYWIRESTHYDISVSIVTAGSIRADFIYPARICDNETMGRLAGHFRRILEQFPAASGGRVHEIDMLTEEEKQLILSNFNDTGSAFPNTETIVNLFERHVERTPDRTALGGVDGEQLTYRELNRQAGITAYYLNRRGVRVGDLVGLLAERSVSMIIGMLAILKAGGAYVPLNPKAPDSRNRFILKDCNIRILFITGESPPGLTEGLDTIQVERAMKCAPTNPVDPCPLISGPGQLAYIIYTSGSTGLPKGVPISHANLSPLLHWGYKHIGIGPGDRSVQNLSYYFDWSAWEIFVSLTSGAALFTISDSLMTDVEHYVDFLNTRGITVLHITPTHFQVLANCGKRFLYLKHLAIGAEKLTLDLARHSFELVGPGCRVYNMYGPTEATIMAAVLEIDPGEMSYYNELTSIPIGKTLGNTRLYILDRYYNPCPIYVSGELFIGGGAVSRGYLNNPQLTAEKFPVSLNGSYSFRRTYKTGDFCRWLPDGCVEFMGRTDQQVKIRGFRIEPGEIENRLLEHQQVKEALVTARSQESGEQYLCAYVVLDSPQPVPSLKDHLSGSLPDYMIPPHIVPLPAMPINPNGKVDLRALPEPRTAKVLALIAPRSETENVLAGIWADVLGIDGHLIGIDSDFFELGGHSLNVTRILGLIHKRLNVEIPFSAFFVHPTIRELALFADKGAGRRYEAIPAVADREYYPLSPAQERLYMLWQLGNSNTVYNISGVMELEGDLDFGMFGDVFVRLIRRHESLRTSFHVIDGRTVQRIHRSVDLSFEEIGSIKNTDDTITGFIRPFDLAQAPLMRVGLAALSKGKYLFILDMHHIISDGTSMGVLVSEFMSLYNGKALPLQQGRYRDFAVWINKHKGADKTAESYWLKQFENEAPVLNIPMDFARPVSPGNTGARIDFELDTRQTAALKELACNTGTTLFGLLVSIFTVLMSKLSGQEDIVVGTVVAGRTHEDLSRVVGMFVNTLALRNVPAGLKTMEEFIREVGIRTAEALQHQDYPFEDLVRNVSITREAGRNPLFDIVFAMQNFSIPSITIPGFHLRSRSFDSGIAKFDMTFFCQERGENLEFTVEYRTAIFREDTIRRFVSYFKEIISRTLQDRAQEIRAIGIMSGREKHRILYRFNAGSDRNPLRKTLHQLVEEQTERCGDRCSVISSQFQVSYRELDLKATRLAHLLKGKGAGPGSIVALMAERSVEMIIGILGILKAGGAYLPIDPDYPNDRIEYMLKDSRASLLVDPFSRTGKIEYPGEIEIVHPGVVLGTDSATSPPTHSHCRQDTLAKHENRLETRELRPEFETVITDNPAYIIYTSGSTGKPKGVLATHANVARVVRDTNYIEVTGNDRVLQLSNFAFDGSVFDIYGALVNGAALVLAERETTIAVDRLTSWIKQAQVSVFFVTTALFNALVDFQPDCFKDVRKVLFGGERVSLEHARKALDYMGIGRVLHVYGPTESTVFATSYPIDRIGGNALTIPIGKPITNTGIYILDKNMRPVPVGVSGEMYIGGQGIARGYLNQPELTADTFVNVQSSDIACDRMYRTGDLARWLSCGNIEFLDRIDHQVKPDPGLWQGEFIKPPLNKTQEMLVDIWAEVLELGHNPLSIDANFFEIGGHSLKAAQVLYKVHQIFNVKLQLTQLFVNPTIRLLSEVVDSASIDAFTRIEPAEEREVYPLSFAQKRQYLLNRMDPCSTGYNISSVFWVTGTISYSGFESVFRRLIRRHESLRTSFHLVSGEPVQTVHDSVAFSVDEIGSVKSVNEAIASFIRSFDLSAAPLMRVGILEIEKEQHLLILDMHHIVSDGVSMSIIAREFMNLYQGRELPSLHTNYRDFALWQLDGCGSIVDRRETYWLERLSGEIPVMNLPMDYPRPAVQSFDGGIVSFELGPVETRALNRMAQERGATLYMVLVMLYDILLAKLSGLEDIFVGTPVAGRNHPDIQPLVGMFVNTLVLRTQPQGDKILSTFLDEVKEHTLAAFENQDYPFEELVEKVGAKRDVSRNPLFDVMFILRNTGIPKLEIPGVTLAPAQYENNSVQFDLTLEAEEVDDYLYLKFRYAAKLFKKETIRRFMGYFQRIAAEIPAQPDRKIAEIAILSEQEKQQILEGFNNTHMDVPGDRTILQFFEDQVGRAPDNIAVIGQSVSKDRKVQLTYGQLDQLANRLTRLLQTKGAGPGSITAVQTERSVELIAAIFAILKIGSIYLPLAADYPKDRVAFILADSNAGTMLTPDDLQMDPRESMELEYREGINGCTPNGLAYIIYTSGSTGRPKGVLVEHRSLLNTAWDLQERYPLTGRDNYLLKTSLVFDVSMTELFGWFFDGGRLTLLVAGGERDPRVIVDTVVRHRVTHINFAPSMFNAFLQGQNPGGLQSLNSLKYIFLAGEALLPPLVKAYRRSGCPAALENIYGPTESTVYACGFSLQEWQEGHQVPIGKPLGNVRLYILNKYDQLQPVGVAGELVIAGAGLARGYLNRPQLTAEKFIDFQTRSYKTGDLCCWLPDGNIIFLGRIDHQVKLRGFRIELGEIESRLSAHEWVNEAVVILKNNPKHYLCAYFTAEKEPGTRDLKEYLARELPPYMVPAYFVQMERLPLNASGKINRGALPEPEGQHTGLNAVYAAPQSGLEKALASVWGDVLGLTKIGTDDNFFDIGGNSLDIIRVSTRLKEPLNREIPAVTLFTYPTIRSLARHLGHDASANSGSTRAEQDRRQVHQLDISRDKKKRAAEAARMRRRSK